MLTLEDLDSIPNIHGVAHNKIPVPTWLLTTKFQYPRGFPQPSVNSRSRGSSFPSGLHGHQAGMWCTDTHTSKTLTSEHGSRNGVMQRKFWVLTGKLQENKTKILSPQFLQNHRIVLGMCFSAHPDTADGSEFTLGYLLQLITVICFYASIEKHIFAMCGLNTLLIRFFLTVRI